MLRRQTCSDDRHAKLEIPTTYAHAALLLSVCMRTRTKTTGMQNCKHPQYTQTPIRTIQRERERERGESEGERERERGREREREREERAREIYLLEQMFDRFIAAHGQQRNDCQPDH